jgi:glycosyltransferase involved in cell wall biosynthesis
MKVKSDEIRKNRVLMLSTSYPLYEGSVSGVFVMRLKRSLVKSNSVKVVTADDNVDTPSAIKDVGVVRFKYAPKKWQTLAHLPGGIPAQLKIRKYLVLLVPFFLLSYVFKIINISKKYDVIHANWAVSGAVASLVKMFRTMPLITTLRGEDVKRNAGFSNSFFLKTALRHSDAVVLVSDDMKALLQEIYPEFESKYSVINNGVDELFLDGNFSANLLLNSEPFFKFSFVGSLVKRKNVIFILKALVMLKTENIPFEMTVVGDGNERAKLESYAKESGLGNQVRFVGEVSCIEVAEVLKTHPIYISASLHEGRPNSVVEAMASGCCCILSDINGHKELYQNDKTGLSYTSSDEHELYSVLMKVIKTPALGVDVGRAARSFVVDSGLSWDNCAESYSEIFDQCLQK